MSLNKNKFTQTYFFLSQSKQIDNIINSTFANLGSKACKKE